MAEPTGHGGDVHAAFDAAGGEQVAQVVVGETGDANNLGGAVHCPLAFADAHHGGGLWFVCPLRFHPFQQLAHVRYHGDFAGFAGAPAFKAGFWFAAHGDFSAHKITVRPGDVFGFGDAETAEGQELNQLRARF